MCELEYLVSKVRGAEPFFLLAGPNVIKLEEHMFIMARQIKSSTEKLGL